jgi:hypothetical protein
MGFDLRPFVGVRGDEDGWYISHLASVPVPVLCSGVDWPLAL